MDLLELFNSDSSSSEYEWQSSPSESDPQEIAAHDDDEVNIGSSPSESSGVGVAANNGDHLDAASGSPPGPSEDIQHQIAGKEAELKYLKRAQSETTGDLQTLKEKLEKSKADRVEQEAAIAEHQEFLERTKRTLNETIRETDATEAIIGFAEAKANSHTREITTLEQEIQDLRTRLPADVPQPQANAPKRGLERTHDSRRKRQRVEWDGEDGDDVEIAAAGFHARKDWTLDTFAKKNGITYMYAPVSEEMRAMTATVIRTLQSLVSPLPLQIRRVLQDTPREMALEIDKGTSSVRSVEDKPYHVFFHGLAEGVRALQKDADVMVAQLIRLRPSFILGADNLKELQGSLENTYTWQELHDILRFGLGNVDPDDPDQLSLCFRHRVGHGLGLEGNVEWSLSKLIEDMSRFAFWATLLGGCLVEGYGRGDFSDGDHGIPGLGIEDMARIIERHHDLEKSPFSKIDTISMARPQKPSTWFRLKPLHAMELDGIPGKILDKLCARVQQLDFNIWDFLRGMTPQQHPATGTKGTSRGMSGRKRLRIRPELQLEGGDIDEPDPNPIQDMETHGFDGYPMEETWEMMEEGNP